MFRHTVFRPYPLEPISGRRVFFVSTAPASAMSRMAQHIEREHGAKVVGMSSWSADRQHLAADLEVMPDADILLVERMAVDVAVRVALERGMEVTFCDNRLVSSGGDGTFEELALATADRAGERFTQAGREPGR